ncbi:MAG: DNA-binding response regulator VicR [Candidatus Saccharibacteria bacterium]|nr:DNA-binding response regulator VicR [Candidatus Saccharibacteria bacterium]
MAQILVVEDDHDLNTAYRIILEHEKHVVETAYNGEEGLKKLKDFTPDLIVLDLLMPVMSGIDFLNEFRNMTSHAKVLVFTNLENSKEINEAFRLGADKCVVKAWTGPQGLLKVVNNILGTPATAKK